jgi:hypothetical protein
MFEVEENGEWAGGMQIERRRTPKSLDRSVLNDPATKSPDMFAQPSMNGI